MDKPLQSSGFEWDKPRAKHVVAAMVAVVLSMVFHAVLIAQIPPLPVGSPPRLGEDARIRPVVLGDVRRHMTDTLERPERFRPQDPALIAAESPDAGAFRELLEELLPPEPADLGVALAGEDRPLAQPEPETERAHWDPRQDIVQIRDRIVPDEIAALPRRITPAVDRTAVAPDITLPADSPAMELAARGEGWMRTGASIGRVAFPGDQPDREREADDTPDRPAVPHLDALDERPDEITDVRPIEQLLALDLTTFLDPADPDHVYFQIHIRRAGAEALPVLPKDVLLIQDASASMTQRTVERCKEGMHHWLRQLRPGDRFDVIAFNDTIERAFGRLTPFDAVTRSRAAFFIENMRAQGGTDIFASLEPLLEMDVAPDRPVVAVMISDGVPTEGIVDSTEIIARFSEANTGRVSVFNVGGGPRVNKYLLDFLSYKNRGDAFMTDHRDQIPVSLDRLAAELSRPVLAQLRCHVAGGEIELYPQMLTHLYLDRPLVVYGRKPVDTEEAVIQIVGRSGAEVKDMVFRLAFDEAPSGDDAIRTEWAWQKVYHLVGEHIRTRDPDVLREIRRMASGYGLRVLYGTDVVPRHF
jgi:uncharacterized protein YegL